MNYETDGRGMSDTTTTELPTSAGLVVEPGSYGFSSWWWGMYDAATNVFGSVALEHGSDLRDQYATARGDSVSEDLAAYHRLLHFVEYRHDMTEKCEKCEYSNDDLDHILDALNEVTRGGYWMGWEGELLLVNDCHDGDASDSELDACGNDWCDGRMGI